MSRHKIYIKNMVCPRCIATVNHIFNELSIPVVSVQLGEVITINDISDAEWAQLDVKLKSVGFELLKDQKSKLVNQIKSIIIDQIHHQDRQLNANFSTLLSERLHYEYSSLSRLFSQTEGVTIERFVLKQKVERVKELIFYDELTLTEIAYKMDYSSVAHLSAQFKKETGMTPSQFKQMRKPGHKALDDI